MQIILIFDASLLRVRMFNIFLIKKINSIGINNFTERPREIFIIHESYILNTKCSIILEFQE